MSYLRFVVLPADHRKTSITTVMSLGSDEHLGEISWYRAWRQYCFWPAGDTVWSSGCLEEVRMYIARLMAVRPQDFTQVRG